MLALLAVSYYLALHGQAALGDGVFESHQVVRREPASASTALTLPPAVAVSGLHRRTDGAWLFASEGGGDLDGVVYEARDVLGFDGQRYWIEFRGQDAGIPEGTSIDALFVDEAGRMVLSFDAPLELDGQIVGEADLVAFGAGEGWSVYWRAADAGVPGGVNLAGAALDPAGVLVLGFDGPVLIGETFFPQGALLTPGAAGLQTYLQDDAWPETTERADFVFALADACAVTADSLRVDRRGATEITLHWTGSRCDETNDYTVYEGLLGDFNSHTPRTTSTGGALEYTLTPADGDRYYLVSAH